MKSRLGDGKMAKLFLQCTMPHFKREYANTGMTKLFTSGESLVCDNPAGDGKIVNLFLQCGILTLVVEISPVKWTEIRPKFGPKVVRKLKCFV